MSYTYHLNRKCNKCGKLIADKSKSGMCGECYRKYGLCGENNPFYGKTHSNEVKNMLSVKCSIGSKKKWEDPSYRKNVLNAVTGLKRTDEFKETQRRNTIKQMKNKEQRDIRSIILKKRWDNGELTPHKMVFSSRSKEQKKFFSLLSKYFDIDENKSIKYKNDENKIRYIYPDAYIEKLNLIIEFNGSFWHADKRRFKENDIVHHNHTAKEIWERDEKRKNILINEGYKYFEVWSDDMKKYSDKNLFIQKIVKIINNMLFV